MSMEQLWKSVDIYVSIPDPVKEIINASLKKRTINKQDFFVREGEMPKTVAFVEKGLLFLYYTSEEGNVVTKHFFPENSFVAATSALIQNQPSVIAIRALEDSVIYELPFTTFKKLTREYQELAQCYISYLELNWVVEKEQDEISLRRDNAGIRYNDFIRRYPQLQHRLKQHHIASYLGITPTQLSRIRKGL